MAVAEVTRIPLVSTLVGVVELEIPTLEEQAQLGLEILLAQVEVGPVL